MTYNNEDKNYKEKSVLDQIKLTAHDPFSAAWFVQYREFWEKVEEGRRKLGR